MMSQAEMELLLRRLHTDLAALRLAVTDELSEMNGKIDGVDVDLDELEQAVRNMKFRGPGVLERLEGAQRVIYFLPGAFTGVAYVCGKRITGLNTDVNKPWIKCKTNGTAVEDAGPPPDPFPNDEEWFEKVAVYGDIHMDRL